MPLNYSKWDNLEVSRAVEAPAHTWSGSNADHLPLFSRQLSDDSDIEEHPNIDKKSMIR